MDFLGVGPLELVVVLIIALIVVGPERLPELARSVGKTLRDLRAMSQGFAAEWQREMARAAELEPGEDLQQTLIKPLKEAQADLQRNITAPLTSAFEATAKLPPRESSSQEQPIAKNDGVQQDVNAPLTSPSEATTQLPPRESQSQEQSIVKDDDAEYVDN
jgi:Tat protein translocase TatB subunit